MLLTTEPSLQPPLYGCPHLWQVLEPIPMNAKDGCSQPLWNHDSTWAPWSSGLTVVPHPSDVAFVYVKVQLG